MMKICESKSIDSDLMLKIKIIIVLFCNTIEEVQFPTLQLSDLLKEIREIYYNKLIENWDAKIRVILEKDNYSCMELDSEEAYNKLMEIFPCRLNDAMRSKYSIMNLVIDDNMDGNGKSKSSAENGGSFYKRLPYSACVPKIFLELKEFVNNCVKFAEGLNSSQTELDDMVRKPTNRLIIEKLRDNIKELISRVSLAQVICF